MEKQKLEKYREMLKKEEEVINYITHYFTGENKMEATKATKTPEGYLQTSSQQIVDINPLYIRIQEGFNYKRTNEAKVRGILQSYRTIGYLASEPLAVEEVKTKDKTIYVVRKGHHRLQAAWEYIKEDPNFKVKALVVKPGTNYQRELEQWLSNDVEKGSELEQGNQLWAFKESKDLTYAEVAERLGIVKKEGDEWVPDIAFVQNRIKLAKEAGGVLTKAIKAGKIKYTTALALISIAKRSENPELTQEIQVGQLEQGTTLVNTATETIKDIQEVATEAGLNPPTQADLTNPESPAFLALPEETQGLALEATHQLIAGQAMVEEAKKVIPGYETAIAQAIKDYSKYASLIKDLGEAIEEELPGALVLWSNTRVGTELYKNLSPDLQKECEAFWLAVEPQKGPKLRGRKISPTQDPSIDKEVETLLTKFNQALSLGETTKGDLEALLSKSPALRAMYYYGAIASHNFPGFKTSI